MGKVRRGFRKSSCIQDLKGIPTENQLVIQSSVQEDFGGLVHNPPCYVLCPSSTEEISSLVRAANATAKLTLVARGNGHSIYGQSQQSSPDSGVVVQMTKMQSSGIHVVPEDHDGSTPAFVEAPAGALWVDVLEETLRHGLSPRSWTDYLNLTLGGTLSNAGLSGQAFRHGPQISNVIQLEVVTGKGDIITCSHKKNPDLFFAVLGGLGQFGIITKVRIQLEEAPQRARYMRLVYGEFEAFRKDIEYLISSDELVNYVEGLVIPNCDDPCDGWSSIPFPGQKLDPNHIPSGGPVLYCIEIAMYYNQHEVALVEKHLSFLLSSLAYLPNMEFSVDLTYFDFLNRVSVVEENLRRIRKWDVPHPWLILFVPRSKISMFNQLVFEDIVSRGVNGPMLMYPLNRSKWETRSSVVIPNENVFYMVGLLRYVVEQGRPLEVHLQQNRDILRICEDYSLGVKQYFPYYETESEWKNHFGDSWGKFVNNKVKFDPNAVLSPSQRIFSRNKVNRVP